MPIKARELVNALSTIAEQQHIRVAVGRSAIGAGICAATCLIGGLLFGAKGMAAGGAAGGILGFGMSHGTFRPLQEVLRNDITNEQRQHLLQSFKEAVKNFDANDLRNGAMLVAMMASNPSLKDTVLNMLRNFLSSELNLKMFS